MKTQLSFLSTVLLLSTALVGCGHETIDDDTQEFRDRVPTDIAIGETVTNSFTYDQERDTYLFDMPVDGSVAAEVLYLGTVRGLDTKLFLYGPADEFGRFSRNHLASDDNGGIGRLSLINATLTAGLYQLVVTTADGRGRGTYRLQLRCTSETCEAPVEGSSSSADGGDSSGF